MNVVILHCHFERGGVTQVVDNHVASMATDDSVNRLILVSGPRVGGLSTATVAATSQIVVDDFDYDPPGASGRDLATRISDLFTQIDSQLVGAGLSHDDTVLHWHNHSLGKNAAAPGVASRLAGAGWKLVLQVHDFAEDNRPENLARLIAAVNPGTPAELTDYLYPAHPSIRYAALTTADADAIRQFSRGVPVTALPNSVCLPSGNDCDAADDQARQQAALARVCQATKIPGGSSWVLYPVRGIRRKNVGEFVLLSQWLRPDQYAGITLCPATEIENASYTRWRQLAQSFAPRAIFDAGHHTEVSFSDNLTAADLVLSTSVAEGFGMAFLEPWLAGRQVVARDLPAVTSDFCQRGVQYPQLYSQIPVPGSAAWLADCDAELNAQFESVWRDVPAAFRPPAGKDQSHRNGTIDFAKLKPIRQTEVIAASARDEGFRNELMRHSSGVVESLRSEPDSRQVAANRELISVQYGARVQSERLTELYQQTLGGGRDQLATEIVQRSAIDVISSGRPFYPCRTENSLDIAETLRAPSA